MLGIAVAACLLTTLLFGCGNEEIPQHVIEATKPAEEARSKPQKPPLTPSDEKFAEIPIPYGAKHRAMVDGRFRYLIAVSPGEMIGYFKEYALPASVELEGAATALRDAVAKQASSRKKMDIVIRPSTPGWTQIEITPEAEPATAPSNEADTLSAAKDAFNQAR